MHILIPGYFYSKKTQLILEKIITRCGKDYCTLKRTRRSQETRKFKKYATTY